MATRNVAYFMGHDAENLPSIFAVPKQTCGEKQSLTACDEGV
jgi:hypothetical protein